MNPDEMQRAERRLIARGMDPNLAHELRWCGNGSLMREAEAASDADLARLNQEWSARDQTPHQG